MKKAIFNFSALTALLMPALAFAQTPQFGYVDTVISAGSSWLNEAITIIMVLITLFFLWSVLRFIMNKDAAKTAEKRQMMINGLIGVFVAVGVWGIIHLAGSITGVDTTNRNGSPNITCAPGQEDVGGVCRTPGSAY
jgi:hypothetical protein